MTESATKPAATKQSALPAPALGLMSLSDGEFRAIRSLVHDRIGVNLTEQKRSLIVGRLQTILRQRGFSTFKQYHTYLERDTSGQALNELVDRITTPHTFFFREQSHFDFLAQVALPQVVSRRRSRDRRDLRIWCAGCASGEEAYSIVMCLREFFGTDYDRWDAGLLATDVSGKALAKAKAGAYVEDRLREVSPLLRQKYFRKLADRQWLVNESIKQEVTFRRFNLMNTEFPFKQSFDIIFCRNVMIYFDLPTRQALVRRFHEFTAPGGYLFVGHSESLGRRECPYEYVMPAVYRRV